MKIEIYLEENCIIIMPNTVKIKILEKASLHKKWIQAKIFTIEELASQYLYKYHDLALYELVKEYKIHPSVASIILETLYYIEYKKYKSSKLNDLVKIKKHLEEKEYLLKNPTFHTYLSQKKIIFYECQYTEDLQRKVLSLLKENHSVIEVTEDEKRLDIIKVTRCMTAEEEVLHTAEEIVDLLEKGVSIDHIKLHIASKEYENIIHRIFHQFHIPYHLSNQNKVIYYDMARYCMELLKEEENFETIGAILRETYDLMNPTLRDVYNAIVQIMNKYVEGKDPVAIKNIIHYELRNICVKGKSYTRVIEQVDLEKDVIEKEDHVFVLGFMMNVFPIIYRDDEYLSDKEKKELELLETSKKNELKKEKIYNKLSAISNLSISFCLHTDKGEYTVSSYLEYLKQRGKVIEEESKHHYYNKQYNQYLLSSALDNFIKYGQTSFELGLLYHQMNPLYQTYDHSYKQINPEKFHQYQHNSLTLSYSSIDSFYKCPFRFYIQYILKIKDEVEETSSLIFGNLVHQILCKVMKGQTEDYESIVGDFVDEYFKEKESTSRDLFYREKYKKEIIKLLSILYKQKERTGFKETYLEESFSLTIRGTLEVTLLGYIDKVLTFDDGKNTYVMVIDYKTGTIDTNFGPVIYGMNMQLLVYLYLLKEGKNNISFAGTYWQNIMKDILPYTEGKTYEKSLEEAYCLDGYTTTKQRIIDQMDRDTNASYIKGLKLKKDGEFYAYSKVLEDQQIDKLLKLTEKNIQDAIRKIEKTDFQIEPKKIGYGKEITGCLYCPYRDICYMEMKDVKQVKEYKNLEFIEGD